MLPQTIRPARTEDQAAIVGVALSSGLFSAKEAPMVAEMLAEHFSTGPAGHHWLVVGDGKVNGAAYVAPEAMADSVYNLYFIAVSATCQRQGLGGQLLDEVERLVTGAGGRLLIIETSDTPGQAAARAFYQDRGYQQRGHIPDFYQPGESKIIFARAL